MIDLEDDDEDPFMPDGRPIKTKEQKQAAKIHKLEQSELDKEIMGLIQSKIQSSPRYSQSSAGSPKATAKAVRGKANRSAKKSFSMKVQDGNKP